MIIRKINPHICRQETIGISYSGGGNRGVVHIGVLRTFLEKKIIPTHIAGVSAGAFVAAFHAWDPHTFNSFTDLRILFSFLSKAFIGLSTWQVLRKFAIRGLNIKSLGDSSKLKDFLDKRLPFKDFAALKATLALGATNVETGQEVWFDKGPIIPALMASSATPGIFPPVKIGENLYIDGGVTDNLPLFELAKEGCGVIYAVNAGYAGEIKRPPKNFVEAILDARDIAQYQTTRYEIELIKSLYPNIKIVHIEPRAGLQLAPYDFTPEKIEPIIEESYQHSRQII
ncbi:MAG TPA: patatin-like phospholipase family protein [Candidatus Nanoarchaeia archaeon]